MSTNRRKAISLIITVFMIVSLLTLTSCNRKYDKDEVITATKILLKDAEMLNKVYYGSGIEYFDSKETNIGSYCKANPEHLKTLGFTTIDELKELTEKTFSDGYSTVLYNTILENLSDDVSIVSPVRYIQEYDEKTGEPTYIMVYSKFEPMLKDSIAYDYDSLTVKESKKDRVYVNVNATVTTSDGKTQNTTLTITLVEEDDGWRIDNPTYANYSEAKDRYDEIKDLEIK